MILEKDIMFTDFISGMNMTNVQLECHLFLIVSETFEGFWWLYLCVGVEVFGRGLIRSFLWWLQKANILIILSAKLDHFDASFNNIVYTALYMYAKLNSFEINKTISSIPTKYICKL